MDILIPLIIFILGAITGFFANHYLSNANQEQRKLTAQASKSESNLEQYKLDVAEHLDSSAKLLEQMNSTCQEAMNQMKRSTQILQQATPVESTTMPFFSQETIEQLAQTANLRHEKRKDKVEPISEAPLDYSGNPSGLFVDKK